MATELLATAATAASSSDLTVVAGTPVTVGLKGLDGQTATVYIYLKDDAAAYNKVGKLTSSDSATVISGPGTYRFTRVAVPAGGGACGVFSG